MGAAESSSSNTRANNPVRPSHRTPATPVSAIKRRVFQIFSSARTLPATSHHRINASRDLPLSTFADGSGRERS
jgi:hypothetical protein